MFEKIFNKKTVLVTGHTGFIGGWLTTWLIFLGARVIGFAKDPHTNPSIFDINNLSKYIIDIRGDITNIQEIKNIIEKYKPEFIFHLAAEALVIPSYENPINTINTNALGTLNILEAIHKSESVKVFINFTSDKCYQNIEDVNHAYTENDALGGYDPYSASKAMSEIITSCYRNSFFQDRDGGNKTSIATIRAGNVIGGGDWAKFRIVPDFIRSKQDKTTLIIRNPESIRPWQYVLEPISGILWLGSQMYKIPKKFNEAWNFGPKTNEATNVNEIIQFMMKIWDDQKTSELKIDKSKKHHEAKFLGLNCTKAKNELNWESTYTISETLSETILWYKNWHNEKIDMYEFTKQQIESYIQKARTLGIRWSLSDSLNSN
jgi:CDP-glucose 4,6-dehydratase